MIEYDNLIICQEFFNKDIVDILRKEVKERSNKINIFNIFYTSKKYLPIDNGEKNRINRKNNEQEVFI